MHPRSSDRLGRGFTLVELLVVIILIGIAAAVVVPRMAQSSDVQVISAARILAADLQYAQNLAISSQKAVTVEFDAAADSYQITSEGALLQHPITKEDYKTAYTGSQGFSQVEIVKATFGGKTWVRFDELGTPVDEFGNASAGGKAQLKAGTFIYEVSVATVTGRVTVASTSSP